MKFAAGFQYIDSGTLFCEMIADYQTHIGEVYFAFPGTASGRPDAGTPEECIEQLEYELTAIRKMGIGLDLLLNGNCYGAYAVSEKFQHEIIAILKYLDKNGLLPEIVTTT